MTLIQVKNFMETAIDYWILECDCETINNLPSLIRS